MAASFGIELHDSFVDGTIKVVRAGEGLVSEVMPLQVAPDPFNVVQLGSVFRQPLDREPVGALGERRTGPLLVWIGPLSRTSTTGLSLTPRLGP